MKNTPKRKMLNLRQTIFEEGGQDSDVSYAEWDHIKDCFPKWLTAEQLRMIYLQFEDQRLDGAGGIFYYYLKHYGYDIYLHRSQRTMPL